jgi:hypothetical protein
MAQTLRSSTKAMASDDQDPGWMWHVAKKLRLMDAKDGVSYVSCEEMNFQAPEVIVEMMKTFAKHHARWNVHEVIVDCRDSPYHDLPARLQRAGFVDTGTGLFKYTIQAQGQ